MWKTTEIPIELFWKILDTGDYSLVGEGTELEQKQAFEAIYDEYYLIKGDQKQALIWEKSKKIALLKHKIVVVQNTIDAILNFPMTKDHRLRLVDALEEIGVKINRDNDLVEECQKVLHSKVGGLKNQLKLAEINLKELTKGNHSKDTLDDVLASYENVLGKDHIPSTITTRRFLAYEKQVQKKLKQAR